MLISTIGDILSSFFIWLITYIVNKPVFITKNQGKGNYIFFFLILSISFVFTFTVGAFF